MRGELRPDRCGRWGARVPADDADEGEAGDREAARPVDPLRGERAAPLVDEEEGADRRRVQADPLRQPAQEQERDVARVQGGVPEGRPRAAECVHECCEAHHWQGKQERQGRRLHG